MTNHPRSAKEARSIGAKHFYTGKPCSSGHIDIRHTANGTCVTCQRERTKRSDVVTQQTAYRAENADAARQRANKWYQDNLSRRKEYNSANKHLKTEWRAANRHKDKEYRDRNAEEIRAKRKLKRPEKNEYSRRVYASCPATKCAIKCRAMVARIMRITGERKFRNTTDILGYDGAKLRFWMELQFRPGMSWDNYGEWHIDHVKPVAVFTREGVTDPAVINALENLQPLWATENLSKRDRYNG